jgi:thiol-disulfide isomerase/thioredoxin
MQQALGLMAQGYALLGERDFSGTQEKFAEAAKIIPCKWIQPSGSILIHAAKGEADEVLNTLEQLADSGWDNPDVFADDAFFGFVRDNPRFQAALDRFKENYDRAASVLANGLPESREAPDVSNEEELKFWIEQQDREFSLNKNFWSSYQELLAKIDLRARILEAQKELAEGDPDFDYGLERLRLAYGLKPRDKMGWGSIADMVRYEADKYAGSVSDENKRREAFYIAGSALSRKYSDDHPLRIDAYREAAEYLVRVDERNENYGAAQALLAANRIKSLGSGEDSTLINQLRAIAIQFDGDHAMYGEISSRLRFDIDRYLWPIPIDKPDIDNKLASLDQYNGKLLLIDFWAIWCGPCRASLPAMREAYERFHQDGFEILSVSLDYPDRTSSEEYRKWIGENGMHWRHIFDGKAWDSELVKRFFVARVPKALLVGPDGSLVAWGDDLHRENLVQTVERSMTLLGQ